jgi:hypothetical protein
VDFSAARRAGIGSWFVMRFSGESKLHERSGWLSCVANFLRLRQIVAPRPAGGGGSGRWPEGRRVQPCARWATSSRGAGDWGVSWQRPPALSDRLLTKSQSEDANGTSDPNLEHFVNKMLALGGGEDNHRNTCPLAHILPKERRWHVDPFPLALILCV